MLSAVGHGPEPGSWPLAPAETFPCSHFPRWWVGEWQKCSATCGQSGLMKRTVLCIQSVGLDEQRALQQADCQHLSKPDATAPCHREVPCPSQWAVGNWSEVRNSVREVLVSHNAGGSWGQSAPQTSSACLRVMALLLFTGEIHGCVSVADVVTPAHRDRNFIAW